MKVHDPPGRLSARPAEGAHRLIRPAQARTLTPCRGGRGRGLDMCARSHAHDMTWTWTQQTRGAGNFSSASPLSAQAVGVGQLAKFVESPEGP